jgi:hypothetical protein
MFTSDDELDNFNFDESISQTYGEGLCDKDSLELLPFHIFKYTDERFLRAQGHGFEESSEQFNWDDDLIPSPRSLFHLSAPPEQGERVSSPKCIAESFYSAKKEKSTVCVKAKLVLKKTAPRRSLAAKPRSKLETSSIRSQTKGNKSLSPPSLLSERFNLGIDSILTDRAAVAREYRRETAIPRYLEKKLRRKWSHELIHPSRSRDAYGRPRTAGKFGRQAPSAAGEDSFGDFELKPCHPDLKVARADASAPKGRLACMPAVAGQKTRKATAMK